MSKIQILIVEDEEAIRQMLRFNLSRAGYEIIEARDSKTARKQISEHNPDLMLVDWMLPDVSGLELTRSLKADPQYRSIPIIMLTAKSQEQDKIAGLDGGADDYVTKPFSPRELISRINALLRRLTKDGNEDEEIIAFGPITINSTAHRIMINDKKIKLGPTEYRLLEHLVRNPERVYSRSQLLDRVWGDEVYNQERTVDVHVRRLRKALSEFNCDQFIQTVRGAGYRLSKDLD